MHRGCFVWTPTPPLAGRRTPRLGPVCVCVCVLSWPGRADRPPGRVLVRLTFSRGCSCCSSCLLGPLRAGAALLVLFLGVFFFPLVRPPCLWHSVFSGPGCLGPWRLVVPPPPCFVFFCAHPPVCWFFFVFLLRVFSFFFFSVLCWLCGAVRVCRGLWGVLVCVVVGLVLRRGPVCACAPLLGAPCLCLPLLCCCLLCCVCPVAPCWRRCSSPCCLWCLLCGVARSTPRALGAGIFFFASGFCWLCPPPPPLGGWSCCPVLWFVVRRVVWCCGLWCVLCCVLCCVGCLCSCAVLCWVVLCCCCCALLSCVAAFCAGFFFFFFCVVPCLSVVLRALSVSVLCWCGAVLVCVRRCSLCAALLPLWRWLVFCVVVCCVCVFAVRPGCPLLSPGGSWWLLVSCFGGVLWCVPGCRAALCCCALCRLALCGFVLLSLVLSCGVSCPGAPSVVLGPCAVRRRGLSCLAALCVFCCGKLLRAVFRRFTLCPVRPGVSCCAFPVLSSLCGVAVGPCSPFVPCSTVPLCCAPWCCAAVRCCGVPSCCFVWFVSCRCVVSPT